MADSNKKTKTLIEEEQEEIALMAAMEEGMKGGIATEEEKREFESWLARIKNIHS